MCLYNFGPEIDTEEKCMTAREMICLDLPMLRRKIRLSTEKIIMKTKILCVEKWNNWYSHKIACVSNTEIFNEQIFIYAQHPRLF